MKHRPATTDAMIADALRHHRAGHAIEAEQRYRRAMTLDARHPDAPNLLGLLLLETGRIDAAVAMLRQAVALNGAIASYRSNLGNALKANGQLHQAIASYRAALERRPDDPLALTNLGVALGEQRRFDQAVLCHRQAIALDPDFADAHGNLALVLLAQGEMTEGWREYEWRWRSAQLAGHRFFTQPQWFGEAAEGRTLLIHAEQGFGDTLQFCRYAMLAAAAGLRVILQVPGPLVRLLRSVSGVDRVIADGDEPPRFDLHCPMLSLPLAFQTSVATIPDPLAYLQADPARVASWRARLAAMPNQGRRVGLVWAGNPRGKAAAAGATDRRRSLAPDRLAPLLDVPGLHFISLQKDGPAAPAGLRMTEFMHEMTDFADTAALIANLDLVISVDTAAAHLAAALGTPVWLLDRFDSCWRWLTGRCDSPWYPSLRIFRQPEPGAWDPALAEVAAALRGLPMTAAAVDLAPALD